MKTSPFSILYQDEDIIVVHKKSGLLVASDRWDPCAERLDKLLETHLREELSTESRIYAVHRIDKETSGLIIYARTAEAHKHLNEAFQNRMVKKTYHAIVYGKPNKSEFTIDQPLCADADASHRTLVEKRKGKEATTHCTVLQNYGEFSLIEARPITGRTHQIRAHLLWAGFPILCDPLYGNGKPLLLSKIKRSWKGNPFEERPLLNRLGLHAYKIKIQHPRSKELMEFTAEYPKDIKSTLAQLGKKGN